MRWFVGFGSATIVVLLSATIAPPTVRNVAPANGATSAARSSKRRSTISAPVLLIAIATVSLFVIGITGAGALIAGRLVWWRCAPIGTARRRRREIDHCLPDALELFVLFVQSGLTPQQAVVHLAERAPAPLRDGFAAVTARMERGEPFAEALRVLHDELGSGAVVLADLVGSADRNGLPIGPVLEQLALESRAARRRYDEASARSLPVKLSFPLVVCTLPSFVLLAIIPAVLAALSSLGENAW